VAVPKTHNTENTIAIRILQNQARMVHAPVLYKAFLYFTEYMTRVTETQASSSIWLCKR